MWLKRLTNTLLFLLVVTALVSAVAMLTYLPRPTTVGKAVVVQQTGKSADSSQLPPNKGQLRSIWNGEKQIEIVDPESEEGQP